MILLLAIALAMLAALLQGGKLIRLAHVSFRYGWLAILAFVMQTTIIYFPNSRLDGSISWKSFIIPISYGIILFVVLLNIRMPGLIFISLGLLLNILVISANGGFMPVTFEALSRAGLGHMALGTENGARVMASKDVILSREATCLWFLSDILVLSKPFPLGSVFSVGDILLALGVFVLLQRTMCSKGPREKANS